MGTKTKIVTQPIKVGENDAFKDDVFGRKDFGESLLNLVSLSGDELVISLDGKWGEGKTTFVKMWQGLLTEKNIHSIYVNAFENDYSDDAFMAIAGAIIAYIEEKKTKFSKFVNIVKQIGSKTMFLMTKAGINIIAPGIIQIDDFKELKNIQYTVVNGIISEKLESHKKDVKLIQSFKDLLSTIPNTLNPEDDNPLIIIIDELDRCKPTYAIDLIEKVKHLFSVKNIMFVLVMNKEQLEESVKSVYGQNIDAHTYLQKFINIEVSLPKKTGEVHDNDIKKYNEMLFNLHQVITWGRGMLKFLEVLANHYNLSLRQIEKVYTTLAVFRTLSGKIEEEVIPILSFLAVIKVIDTSLYQALLHQRITYEELCSRTGLSDRSEDEHIRNMFTCLNDFLITDEELDQLDPDDPARTHYQLKRKVTISTLAKKLSMFTVA